MLVMIILSLRTRTLTKYRVCYFRQSFSLSAFSFLWLFFRYGFKSPAITAEVVLLYNESSRYIA